MKGYMAEQSTQFADIMQPDPETDRLVEELAVSASEEPPFIDKIAKSRANEATTTVISEPITPELKPLENSHRQMALTVMTQDARAKQGSL